ncbi:MAG: tRNA-dihydrouridine synthase family protein [Methanosarcinaceae archaeon]|nr:tRNA-dihydrouridine synthase family protein [Methanosarcinaceae archaeon]MDD4330906.1 tRNA-dihydrouridine synthase family protein [Methanosarcinaceae archaeon]MDD4749327.1 tRNA-dihydrouridine synthase family protein [Methanosarcinaceae archaeon]
MKIGSTKLPGNLFLAPMADVTNLAFRLLCKEHGADFTYTEMISADALVNENRKSVLKSLSAPEEGAFGIQLVGSKPETLSAAALFVEEEYKPAVIDVNLGCPARQIRDTGCGSALLEKPDKIYAILKELSENLGERTPISAKIRLLESEKKTLEIARLIEKAGASALTVHGRTAKEMYSGKSKLLPIKAIKEELSIPIIANGDIRDEKSAAEALEFTGCDGLMIGRAARGNPFIFRRIRNFLETGEYLISEKDSESKAGFKSEERQKPWEMREKKRGEKREENPLAEKLQIRQFQDFETYVKLLEKYELLNSTNLRIHAHWFTKGLRGSRQLRERINNLNDSKAIIELMKAVSEDQCKK